MVNMTATLLKALQELSSDGLARIGEHWAITDTLASDWLEADEELALVSIISGRFAWDALSLEARNLLHQSNYA